MASPQVVRRSLTAFANNFNKGDRWVDDTLKLWARGLASISDKDLVRGTETWCRTKRTLPNLARLLELIAADPTTSPAAVLHGCPACDGTGWREMARHYNDNGRDLVRSCVAACDCSKGVRLATGVVDHWRTVLDAWERDPRTERVYYSTAQQPHLTTQQRHTAEQLAGMAERAKKATASVNGWRKPIKDRP
tara:strand:+ start:631 stop:1206 length:576 start_codon:yes stop_codon:yes gene_type:complete